MNRAFPWETWDEFGWDTAFLGILGYYLSTQFWMWMLS